MHWTNMYVSMQEEQAVPIPDYRYRTGIRKLYGQKQEDTLEEKRREGFWFHRSDL